MWNLYKAKLTLLWSPLSTEKDAAIIKWSLNQLSDCLHWFLYNTPTTIAANRVFSKPEKNQTHHLKGEFAAFANLDKMCFVKYFYVTHEQQLEKSLLQSLNPYSIQYRFIMCLLAFFASHSIWNCDSKFGFRTDIQVVLKGIPIKRIAWLFLLSRFCLLKKEVAQKDLLLWARKGFVLGINLFQIAFLFFPQPIRSLRDGTFSTREPSVRESTVMTIRNFSILVKRVFGNFFWTMMRTFSLIQSVCSFLVYKSIHHLSEGQSWI